MRESMIMVKAVQRESVWAMPKQWGWKNRGFYVMWRGREGLQWKPAVPWGELVEEAEGQVFQSVRVDDGSPQVWRQPGS